ncbi:MAG: hypothetical protein WAZ10_01575 [Minisyncoccia bacterium]
MKISDPTCTLRWNRNENGRVTTGDREFFTDFPQVLQYVISHTTELRHLGGEWEFTLQDTGGRVIPLDLPTEVRPEVWR